MKTSELMLGDIITFKDSVEIDKTPIPVKVIALGYQHHGNENEALVQIGDDETYDIVTIDDEFVGYPLTAEILEKNGWENSAPDVWQKEYGGLVFYWENGTGRFGMNDFRHLQEQWEMHLRIMHTHQLQHALRLCGIEHEITL